MGRHETSTVLRSIGAVTLVALVLTPASPVAAREVDAVVDLRTAPSWLVTGGSRIGPVGDVNGDAVADAAVARCASGETAGEVRVVWGPFEPDEVAFEGAGEGFSIRGARPNDFACRLSMHAVGDVNGDGLADVLVGASRDYRGPPTVYVVFGKPDTETVDLRAFDEGTQGDQGYVVHGWSVTYLGINGVGDMNQDGRADFAVGGGDDTYVVFGQASTTSVDLRTFEAAAGRGFLVTNRCRECVFGSVGDVNGDGVPDVAVGGVGRMRYDAPGTAYVVFGKSDTRPVDTSKRTSGFFKIKGDWPGGMWSGAIEAAGDVNGDGLGDVVVGMPKVYSCCHGKAAVVFGKTDTSTVRLAELGSQGFQIVASEARDFFGYEAIGIGDVNGDGLDDIGVGAPGHDYPGRGGPGAVFVIYGKKSSTTLLTAELGDAGFLIVGRESVDWTGASIGVPGDMNGDGVPDLMISAVSGGKAYLLWL